MPSAFDARTMPGKGGRRMVSAYLDAPSGEVIHLWCTQQFQDQGTAHRWWSIATSAGPTRVVTLGDTHERGPTVVIVPGTNINTAASLPFGRYPIRPSTCETAARADELLLLDIPDLDTTNRCAPRSPAKVVPGTQSAWHTGTAQLLPRLLARPRTRSGVPDRPQGETRCCPDDIDPSTLWGGLSNRRALELFEHHTTDRTCGPLTLHQLRHSRLTHAAEDGASTPMLMRMSGHTSVRSPGRYARPSAEALIRWQAHTGPAAHKRR